MKLLKKHVAPVVCLLALAAIAFTAACIHKTGGAVTPWERVTTYNAALAEANYGVEQGAEACVSANLMTPVQAAPLINWTGQVAIVHQQITAILAQGQVTQANLASVTSLVQVITGSIAQLPAGALGIKNPKSQQTFQVDVQSIATLANSVLSALQAIAPTPPTSSGSSRAGLVLALLFLPFFGMALSAALIEEIVSLIVQLGPLAVDLFLKLESLLNLTPDEKQNIANAIAASNQADQQTVAKVTAWMQANGFTPTFTQPALAPAPTPATGSAPKS